MGRNFVILHLGNGSRLTIWRPTWSKTELNGTNVHITTRLNSILHQGFLGRVTGFGGLDVHLPEVAVVADPLCRNWNTEQVLLVVGAIHTRLVFSENHSWLIVEEHIGLDDLKGLVVEEHAGLNSHQYQLLNFKRCRYWYRLYRIPISGISEPINRYRLN